MLRIASDFSLTPPVLPHQPASPLPLSPFACRRSPHPAAKRFVQEAFPIGFAMRKALSIYRPLSSSGCVQMQMEEILREIPVPGSAVQVRFVASQRLAIARPGVLSAAVVPRRTPRALRCPSRAKGMALRGHRGRCGTGAEILGFASGVGRGPLFVRRCSIAVCRDRPTAVTTVSLVVGTGLAASAGNPRTPPGPPARTLKLEKPGWRPRSASAVGSARCAYPCPGERGSHSSNRLPSGSVAQPNRP